MSNFSDTMTYPHTLAVGDTDASFTLENFHRAVIRVQTDANFSGTAFTISESYDGSTYKPLTTIDGTPVTIVAGANANVTVNPLSLVASPLIRLTSNAAQASNPSTVSLIAGRL